MEEFLYYQLDIIFLLIIIIIINNLSIFLKIIMINFC